MHTSFLIEDKFELDYSYFKDYGGKEPHELIYKVEVQLLT